jgi:hypothetical protein
MQLVWCTVLVSVADLIQRLIDYIDRRWGEDNQLHCVANYRWHWFAFGRTWDRDRLDCRWLLLRFPAYGSHVVWSMRGHGACWCQLCMYADWGGTEPARIQFAWVPVE